MNRTYVRKSGTGLVLAALAAAGWAHAATGSAATSARDAGVVSGGVSLNSRDALRANAPSHNVKMVFALNTGNYVTDVQVRVKNSAGSTVIDQVSDGPWLFAKLPPGSYVATATYNGKAVTQRFSVGKSGTRNAQFRWPASVERDSAGAKGEGGGEILGTGPQEPRR